MNNYTATRVTPEQAYERYLLIKQGKENQLYSMQTVSKIKREYPETWHEIMAMDAYGLKGGGNVVAAVVTAGVGYALDRAFNHHGHHRANVHATIGVDHRGNIAGGFNRQSVNWQLGNRRRNQDQLTTQITETFNKDPYVQLPRKNKNHEYWKELEALPRKVKLKKELQTLFKPESQYSYSAHNYRSSPWLQIYDARHMEIDTTQYQTNRTYYSKLYKSMKTAGIQHQDILSIWGNPYIGVVTKWDTLSYQRQQSILKDCPETDRIAWNFSNAKRELAWEISRANTDWAGVTKDFVSDLLIFGVSAAAEAYVGKMYPPVHAYAMPAMVNSGARIASRISPKLAKIDYKLNNLYKKAEDFFRKKCAEIAKKRTIPTAESKIEWHKKMMQEKKWKPCHGEWRGYYEGTVPGSSKVYRFKPTFEKNEYEVYRYFSGKGQHCGIFRTEGDRALEVIEESAKWTFKGKW